MISWLPLTAWCLLSKFQTISKSKDYSFATIITCYYYTFKLGKGRPSFEIYYQCTYKTLIWSREQLPWTSYAKLPLNGRQSEYFYNFTDGTKQFIVKMETSRKVKTCFFSYFKRIGWSEAPLFLWMLPLTWFINHVFMNLTSMD